MRFVIAADEDRPVVHHVVRTLAERGHEATLLPIGIWADVATRAARAVAAGDFDQGVVMCWTGTGVSIAANKVRGIRAAHCTDVVEARNAREHNDANVLCLGGRMIGIEPAKALALVFLKTDFAGGRHQKRVEKIMGLER